MMYLISDSAHSAEYFFANTSTHLVSLNWADTIEEAYEFYKAEKEPNPCHPVFEVIEGKASEKARRLFPIVIPTPDLEDGVENVKELYPELFV